jgi:EAL domain-containing protein (putative c-di-GMP-specific phosphodiesterase class I)
MQAMAHDVIALQNGLAPPATALADALEMLGETFHSAGAAAVMVVQLPFLGEIERCYGPAAFDKATQSLRNTVVRHLDNHFRSEEYVAATAPRAEEVVVLVPRPRSQSSFYNNELPKLTYALAQHLETQKNRIVYPYGAERAYFLVGHGVAIHNPSLRPDRQLLLALESAREDAELTARLRKRETARQLLGIVLQEQIRCVYQPVVGIQDGKVFGYEALVRGPQGTEWQSPLVLFRQAEEHGLGYELDCLCRKAAFRDGPRWSDSGLMLFLNCLPSAIHDPTLSEERLRQTLESCGLTPSQLVLEVSERESIQNFNIFRETRERYRNLGIKVALDDTGAGYAGLETVMELAPDFIKVDISLVRSVDTDTGRRVLLQALQDISGVIGAKLIAEGVETTQELETLRRMGVPYGQGYLLGRPGPLRELPG